MKVQKLGLVLSVNMAAACLMMQGIGSKAVGGCERGTIVNESEVLALTFGRQGQIKAVFFADRYLSAPNHLQKSTAASGGKGAATVTEGKVGGGIAHISARYAGPAERKNTLFVKIRYDF